MTSLSAWGAQPFFTNCSNSKSAQMPIKRRFGLPSKQSAVIAFFKVLTCVGCVDAAKDVAVYRKKIVVLWDFVLCVHGEKNQKNSNHSKPILVRPPVACRACLASFCISLNATRSYV